MTPLSPSQDQIRLFERTGVTLSRPADASTQGPAAIPAAPFHPAALHPAARHPASAPHRAEYRGRTGARHGR